MSKYGAVPTEVDGVRFASKAEARRYQALKLLLAAGEITDLTCHPRWPLVVNGVEVGTYIADFRYWTGDHLVVEDVKGGQATVTPLFRLKKRLMKALSALRWPRCRRDRPARPGPSWRRGGAS